METEIKLSIKTAESFECAERIIIESAQKLITSFLNSVYFRKTFIATLMTEINPAFNQAQAMAIIVENPWEYKIKAFRHHQPWLYFASYFSDDETIYLDPLKIRNSELLAKYLLVEKLKRMGFKSNYSTSVPETCGRIFEQWLSTQ